MKDMNGIEIKLGNIVKVDNAYFKADNGLWYVKNTNHDLTLVKINKSGKVSVTEKVSFWPLKSFCSDSYKNAMANEHNKEHATIEVVTNVPTFGVAQAFADEAKRLREVAYNRKDFGWPENEYSDLLALAEKYEKIAEENQQEAPAAKVETGIKFYFNGIKVDGGRLISCGYHIDGENVSIYANGYNNKLPGRYFDVVNHTDSQSDYFDVDHVTVTPEHPLHKYALYYAAMAEAKDAKRIIPKYEKRLEDPNACRKYYVDEINRFQKAVERFEGMTNPGQPNELDYQALDALRDRKRREKEETEAREMEQHTIKVNKQINDGRKFIESVMRKFPLVDGEPIVTIEWSEYPAFYSWSDGELKMSLMAADVILHEYDNPTTHEEGGYFKTKITVTYIDTNGEEQSITDRYDLGDMEFNGLEAMIKAWDNPALIWLMNKAKVGVA